MAKHLVKCPICNESFDRGLEEFVLIGRRYAHKKCFEKQESLKTQEEKDKEKLEQYILKLFNETKISARVRRQIAKFKEEEGYSYSGMLKALVYFYEIKRNPIEKSNGGIGIVPYIYKDAYNYYYALWVANQKNEHKLIQQYVPQVQEIKIPVPQRKMKKRKMFSFLDIEQEENDNVI